MNADLKFVVPCINEAAGIATAIAALAQHTASRSGAVVVVDNAGEETCFKYSESIDIVRNKHRIGSYASRNKGAFLALKDCQWLCFLDDDVRIRHINGEIELTKLHPTNLYSSEIEFNREPENSLEYWYKKNAFNMEYFRTRMGFFPTIFLLVHGSTFKSLGGFDGALLSSGDLDFCRRASNNDSNRLVLMQNTRATTSLRTASKIILKYQRLFFGQSLLAKMNSRTSGTRLVSGIPYLIIRVPVSLLRLVRDALVESIHLQPSLKGSLRINWMRFIVSIRVLFMSEERLRIHVGNINDKEISKT